MDCHASSAYLYSDGLSGEKAWCAPTAEIRDEYYLQVDLKNSYYISALMIQGLSSGYVTQFKWVLYQVAIIQICHIYYYDQMIKRYIQMFSVTYQ